MAAFTTVLAFDLGASTGRAIRAVYDGERLKWKEIHRFDNIPAVENGHLRWNMEALLGEIRIAIQKAGKTDSLAFDTWGVDFGLLDADGKLLEDPVHYRDERTKDWPQRVAQKIELHSLYVRTGNQYTVPVAGITRGTARSVKTSKASAVHPGSAGGNAGSGSDLGTIHCFHQSDVESCCRNLGFGTAETDGNGSGIIRSHDRQW